MTPRIKKAIDIFLDAINNGTLAKGTCSACAVGNLVAHELGIKPYIQSNIFEYKDCDKLPNTHWIALTSETKDFDISLGEQNINLLDFTLEEVIEIERAFELNTRINYHLYYKKTKEDIRADQIAGLKAVVKVMLTFDDCKDDVNEIFVSKAELIPV